MNHKYKEKLKEIVIYLHVADFVKEGSRGFFMLYCMELPPCLRKKMFSSYKKKQDIRRVPPIEWFPKV